MPAAILAAPIPGPVQYIWVHAEDLANSVGHCSTLVWDGSIPPWSSASGSALQAMAYCLDLWRGDPPLSLKASFYQPMPFYSFFGMEKAYMSINHAPMYTCQAYQCPPHSGVLPASTPGALIFFLFAWIKLTCLSIIAKRFRNPGRQITTGDCRVHSTSYDKGRKLHQLYDVWRDRHPASCTFAHAGTTGLSAARLDRCLSSCGRGSAPHPAASRRQPATHWRLGHPRGSEPPAAPASGAQHGGCRSRFSMT